MALSGEYRKLSLANRSNASPTEKLDCTGLRFNCTATSVLWGGNVTTNLPAVDETISEVAFETTVPLLKDVAFAKSLDVNGAVRYAHYAYTKTVDATTFKLGAT